MIACLEKSEGNVDFHEIVDFLTASTIHYALTQIHATFDGKTVVISESSVRSNLYFNDEDGIACLTNDAIFENLALMGYESDSDKLTFQKALFSPQWKYLIHTILHCLSSKSTSWNEFSTNIASTTICLANAQKFNFSKLIFDGMLRNLDPNTKKFLMYPRQALQEDTQLPQTSVLVPNVADEAVFKEWDDNVERAATTDASLDAEQDSGNILKTQSTAIPNVPLYQEIGTGGSPRCQEAMGGIIAQTRSERVPTPSYDSPLLGGNTPVLDLEKEKDAQAVEILKLKKRVKQLKRKAKSSIPPPKRRLYNHVDSSDDILDEENVSKQGRYNDKTKPMFDDSDFAELDDINNMVDDAMDNVEGDAETQGRNSTGDAVTTAGVSISAVEPRTPPITTTTVFEDEDLTIAQTLVKMRSKKAKEKGVAFRDVEEFARPTRILPTIDPKDKGKGIMQEPEKPLKNPIKAQIQRDAEIHQKLFEEEQAQFEREQRIARKRVAEQEAKDAALIEQMEDIQARIDAYALLAKRLQQIEREQFTIEEKSRMLVEMITERKRFFAAQRVKQIRNKPPTKAQLRNKMVTYLKHMGKYTHSQLKSKSFEEIQKLYEKEQKWINDFVPMDSKEGGKKAENSLGEEQSTEKEKELSEEELHKLLVIVPVEEVYVEALQVKYPIIDSEKFNKEDLVKLWDLVKERYMHDPLTWRLYDTCGVHHVSTGRGHNIFMLVEKDYPLSKGVRMLMLMLVNKLLVEQHSEMANELLRKIFIQENQSRQQGVWIHPLSDQDADNEET
ncbi:hypothetical protein Tco_1523507 [Tanacetum coccineum]